MTQFAAYAKYYDDMYQSKNYALEVSLIKDVFARFAAHQVKSILSLGCGTGTYETILAKQGYSITGIDLSADMLKEARVKLDAAGVSSQVELVQADIRSLPTLGKTYDAAIMMFNIAGYFHTVADLTAVVAEVAKYLKLGGTFQFDAWYGPAVIADPPTDRTRKIEKNSVAITRVTKGALDTENKLIKIKFDVTEERNGTVVNHIEEDHPMRYFDLTEIEQAISDGGLKLIKITSWDNLDLPPSDKQWDMQVIAQKA